jgi:tartrate-resistant acid phosphatase type 5
MDMPLSRRRFLKQTFAFSAMALLGNERFSLAADAAPAAGSSSSGPVHHYLAVGDFGVVKGDLPRQQAVASQMIKYTAQTNLKPDALFMLGDNFYGGLAGKGVRSPRWEMNLEGMYPAETFPGPMYAMLGNHDYNDEAGRVVVDAELRYRQANPAVRWTLPAKWYRLSLPAENPLATILVLDTNFSYRDAKMVDDHERDVQLRWLTRELEKPRTTPWLFVFGHHPVFSAGHHGDTPWSTRSSRGWRSTRSICISRATITTCSTWRSTAIRRPSSSAAPGALAPAKGDSTPVARSSKPFTASPTWSCGPMR